MTAIEEDASIRLWRDTAANWTAANPVLADGEPGWETDTRLLKIGDGVTHWNALSYYAPGAAGAQGKRVLLADTTLAVAAASIDFSGISAGYDDLELVFGGRSAAAVAALVVNLTMNNDTTDANYGSARLATTGAAPAGTVGTGRGIGIVPGSTVTAGKAGNFTVTIPDYRGTFDRAAYSRGQSAGVRIDQFGLMWINTAAINRLTLTNSDGSNFIAGSRARLYGLKDVA